MRPVSTISNRPGSCGPMCVWARCSPAGMPGAGPPVPSLSAPAGLPMAGASGAWRQAAGGFWFTDGDAKAPAGVFLAESAIDALSACALGAGGPVSIRASTAGTCRRLPDWLGAFGPAFIICGFDADGPGDDAAGALIASDERVRRARPSGAKDRNEQLLNRGS